MLQISTFQIAGNYLLKVRTTKIRAAYPTAPRRLEKSFPNGLPRTIHDQKIEKCGDGKRRQKPITLGINRISGFMLPPWYYFSKFPLSLLGEIFT